MSKTRFPGWRTMSGVERRNARMHAIFDDARARKALERAPQTNAFVERFASFTPYAWPAIEGYSDDQAEDAIASMNRLIEEARKITGDRPLPDSAYGEQESAA